MTLDNSFHSGRMLRAALLFKLPLDKMASRQQLLSTMWHTALAARWWCTTLPDIMGLGRKCFPWVE